MVDIFEAGPIVECPRDEIRTVRESRIARLLSTEAAPATGPDFDRPELLITSRRSFRVGKGPVSIQDEGISIPPELACALEIEVGEEVRYAPLRAAAPRRGPAGREPCETVRGGSR
jgi:arginine N-succinyltransferase